MEQPDPATADKLTRDNKNDLSTFASGAMVVFFGKIFRTLVQYIFLVVISKMLGVESFGLYMLGFTIITFTEIVARLGLDNAAIRFVSMHQGTGEGWIVKAVISRAILYAFLFSLPITAFLFFSADILANQLFSKPGLKNVLIFLSVSIPFLTVMSIAIAATQGFKRMDYSAYCRDIFFPLFNFSLAILLSLIYSKLTGVLLAWVLTSIFSLILSLYYLQKVISSIPPDKPVPDIPTKLPGILSYSSPLLLVVLLTTLLTGLDTMMLGYFRSSTEVGLYAAATRTALLTGLILTSVNTMFSPMIADLYNREKTQQLGSMFKLSGNWIYIFSLPIFIIFLLFAKDVMAVFGAEFVSAWPVLVIISIAFFLNASTGSVGLMLIMSGYQKLMLYNSITIFIFNIIANYLLIPTYGMIGAAISSCLSIVSYNIIMLVQVYLRLGMHPYNMKFLRVTFYGLASFLAFFLLVTSIPGPSLLRLILIAPLFLIIYFFLIYKKCIGDEEMVVVDKIIAKFRAVTRSSKS